MGFFSRIKKLWGADETPQTPEPVIEQAAPTEAPAGAAAPLSHSEKPVSSPAITEAIIPSSQEEPLAEPISEPALEPSTAQFEPEQLPIMEPEQASAQEIEAVLTDEPEILTKPATAQPEPAPTVEPKPETVAKLEPAAEQPKKTSGWRKLFGFGAKQEDTAPSTAAEPTTAKPELLFQEKPTPKSDLEPWQEQLVAALRSAEPKLSTWMLHLLDGVDRRGESLWSRLRFLFSQLEIPTEEANDFITRFDTWLKDMDYDHVDEFRSELQYRMALALDLEDEEDERNRLFLKLSAGLGKTREQLTKRIDQLLSLTGSYDDAFWDELEEILLMADVGVTATQELFKRLKPKVRKAGDDADFKALLKEEVIGVFQEPKATQVPQLPEVVLMVGVNGAGKTTTIAKLAHRAQMQGRKVLVAAGDTFRAAAIEQLHVWAKRVGAGFYAKEHGSDPAAVAYEALDYAIKEGYDLVFVDTAGRLQTKHNLMEELKKINRVLGKKLEGAPHRTILVLDATTGQNALSQVKLFSEASPVDEIVLTKLDGTAKGGIIVAIALEFGIPISFVGLGEKMEDLRPFSGQEFANALFG